MNIPIFPLNADELSPVYSQFISDISEPPIDVDYIDLTNQEITDPARLLPSYQNE